MTAFPDKTEFGISFRSMSEAEQKLEVVRLNKGAATGMKGAIKKRKIDVQFKDLVKEKMKDFIIANRTQQSGMFRAVPHTKHLQSMQIKFLSVGEWVEVEPDISPGWNSEGGIGVITLVTDGLADVKYVLTRWVEKLIPLRRLTTIIMPHREPAAGLRPSRPIPTAEAFVSKPFEPEHKGKTVLTCNKWARMYWEHHMALWITKNPHRKYVSEAKKVNPPTVLFSMAYRLWIR